MPARRSPGVARTRARWLVLSVAALALTLAACSGAARSGDIQEGPADGDAARIEMQDNTFAPAEVAVPAGEEVTIELTNGGNSVHDFTIEDLDVSTGAVAPGDVVTVTVPAIDAATGFACTLHGGMEGTLTTN
ncbi:MAG: cupredoxin domain-containing protein [Actinomycetota bacterium]